MNKLAVLTATVSLTACAETPPVTMTYYFPKAQSEIAITQVITCTFDNDVRSASSITVKNSYVPNYDRAATFKFHSDGGLRDTDTAVTLTDDGMLLGINSTGTGQGSAFVKAAVALASAFTGVSAAVAAKTAAYALGKITPPTDPFCDSVRANEVKKTTDQDSATKDKATVTLSVPLDGTVDRDTQKEILKGLKEATLFSNDQEASALSSVTLTYHIILNYRVDNNGKPEPKEIIVNYVGVTKKSDHLFPDGYDTANPQISQVEISPDPSSAYLYSILNTAKLNKTEEHPFKFSFTYTKVAGPAQPELDAHDTTPYVEVPKLSLLHMIISGPVSDEMAEGKRATWGHSAVWSGDLILPEELPAKIAVSRAPLFGVNKTILGLAPSGLVNKLQYAKTSGAADLLGAGMQVATQVQGHTDAQDAASVQAKADLIYQQSRLAECQTNAATCPSK